MKKEENSLSLLGASSLLTIFSVLCLTVLALLSLSSVTARQRLSDSAVSSVTAYYEADTRAELIFARLRNGETPEEVELEETIYRYQCPISENRSLFVELEKGSDGWKVLRWQEVAEPLTIDDNLPVWDGK